MNQIACNFLFEDVFIINICNDYRATNDKFLLDIVTTCIGFNRANTQSISCGLECNFFSIQMYKGIVIVKNFENFSSEYIMVDVFVNNVFKNVKKMEDVKGDGLNAITKQINNINLNIFKEGDNFIQFLDIELKKNINFASYNSLFNGEKYYFSLNDNIKLDFDILMHNFLQIVHKNSIDDIEFTISY